MEDLKGKRKGTKKKKLLPRSISDSEQDSDRLPVKRKYETCERKKKAKKKYEKNEIAE